MNFEEWKHEFKNYLVEYGAIPSKIDELIIVMDEDIKIAFSKQADPEIAAIHIGKEFFKARKDAKAQKIFKQYSSAKPKIYSLSHCLDTVFTRWASLDAYLEQLRSESTEPNGPNHQICQGLKICEERFSGDISLLPDSGFSSLAGILIMRLNTTEDKILLVSILRSKYSVIAEVISVMSRINSLSVEAGLPDVVEQQHFDGLNSAIDEIKNSDFFLMDYSEPIELEELMEDLQKAQLKSTFDVIIISGLTYLEGSYEKDFFKNSCRLLRGYVDQFGIDVLVLP